MQIIEVRCACRWLRSEVRYRKPSAYSQSGLPRKREPKVARAPSLFRVRC